MELTSQKSLAGTAAALMLTVAAPVAIMVTAVTAAPATLAGDDPWMSVPRSASKLPAGSPAGDDPWLGAPLTAQGDDPWM
ncbi:hypothetical protein AMK26_16190 [Streptomyces sp. CB03234]|uniref:hypothetical protein n=1 Tax=Streptomyces sp. (strain CB03234) TaxID=1703937 RepID=UPI000938AC5B|nr:hypothetical protein [Streptomyces sp. CB03234]OKK04818.1 hypothetical protein AMK26_16190 [Streptomyces sp. CB03234]